MEKNIFILYEDDKIQELSSIHEVYKEITSEQIKKNPKVFFYPVLLIYYREILYNDEKTMRLNNYSDIKFHNLEEDCLKLINFPIALTNEQKRQNYLEYVKAQKLYDRKRKYSMEPLNGSFDMIVEEEDQKDFTSNKTDIPCNNNYYNNLNNKNIDKNDDNNSMLVEDNYKISEEKTEKKRTYKRNQTQYINHNNNHFKKFDFFKNIM